MTAAGVTDVLSSIGLAHHTLTNLCVRTIEPVGDVINVFGLPALSTGVEHTESCR